MKTLIPSLVLVVALLPAVPARSADKEKTPQEIENLARELVRKLGDSKFREREAASRELAELGLGALKAIEEGLENPELEIVVRCERLYPKVRRLDLERRIAEFAADKEGRMANTLPLGVTYEKICGKDANARKYYVEICKNHLQLLDYAANNPIKMGEAFNDFNKEIEKRDKGFLSPETEIAALLLIAADEKIGPSILETNFKQIKGGDRNYQRFIGALWAPKYEAVITDANNGRFFRKLLFAWAKRLPEPLAMQSFLFFLRDKISKRVMNLQSDSDTLQFLMDFAVSTTAQQLPYQKGEVMSMLAGASISMNEKVVYFEEKFLKDKRVLLSAVGFDVKGSKRIMVETRACDYALAVCVKLSGQSYQDYGFDILGSRSEASESWIYAGFTKDETRQAAFKKYEEWRKANPIKKN